MSLFHDKAFSKEESDCILDASGVNCPVPILRAKKMLNEMEKGQVLHVIASDQGSLANFTALCKQNGHELREQRIVDDKYHHLMRKV